MLQKLFCILFLFSTLTASTQKVNKSSFKIVPLGVKGGSDESNLSAYMIAASGSNNYLCMDAGTIRAGIDRAIAAGIFKTNAEKVLKNYIKGYCISHAHLDHVAGLVMNSPDDSSKNIYGLRFCLDILKDKYFTWKNWANFTNEGDKPTLNKYHYSYLTIGDATVVEHTTMNVTAFDLSHSNPYQSTAFLLKSDSSYLLYLGDTGADEMEKSNKLHQLWQTIAPLVISKQLKGIFIEVSFPDQQPVKQLFGHLTPKLLMQEFTALSKLTGRNALRNFKVLITHIKPAGNHQEQIKKQLKKANDLQLELVYPKQGEIIRL